MSKEFFRKYGMDYFKTTIYRLAKRRGMTIAEYVKSRPESEQFALTMEWYEYLKYKIETIEKAEAWEKQLEEEPWLKELFKYDSSYYRKRKKR